MGTRRVNQKVIRRRLEEHESAAPSFWDEGIALMELANRAADLFAEQPASMKRRLLEFALSNSFWANGELTPEFRQPFDMLADRATVGAQEMAAGELTSSHHQEELPVLDTFRTFFRAPPLDFRIQCKVVCNFNAADDTTMSTHFERWTDAYRVAVDALLTNDCGKFAATGNG